jgi:Glyoxalase/Bleomycin resistance protein/Dioxygenase superfamily
MRERTEKGDNVDKLSFGMPLGAVTQVAHVVEDIDREMERWTLELGLGPFFVLRHFVAHEVVYRGKPGELDLDVALVFRGSTCFELIQQNNHAPSVYRELVESRGYGFHHFGIATRQFDADLARRAKAGAEVASSGVTGFGSRVAYLDTVTTLGGMTELIEITPPVEDLFGMMYQAAESWDGRDPVRVLGP